MKFTLSKAGQITGAVALFPSHSIACSNETRQAIPLNCVTAINDNSTSTDVQKIRRRIGMIGPG
jgi:hypothetical protein